MKLKIFITIFLLLATIDLALAQTTSFKCDYPNYSDEKGNHKVSEKFALQFVLDSKEGNAYMIGNLGSTKVAIVRSADGVTFIEITPAGNVMTTTITSNGNSVHSRNTVIFGKIVPTQYYGKCLVQ